MNEAEVLRELLALALATIEKVAPTLPRAAADALAAHVADLRRLAARARDGAT